nr:MAG TPA: hypothetical protein [Caudoviricetes sp.]
MLNHCPSQTGKLKAFIYKSQNLKVESYLYK